MVKLPTWEKRGLVYKCDREKFFHSHTTRPVPFLLDYNRLRIFFSSRDANDIPYPTFIDVDPSNSMAILAVNESPLLQLGRLGTFDDSGITPVSILRRGRDSSLMYYVGWKRRRYGVTIETSIGVAELYNNASSLRRIFEGPIIGQDREHPLLVAAPFVVPYRDGYVMWYCSGTEWREMSHGPEMLYTVYEAFSKDGIDWIQSSSTPKIPYAFDGEVISAPWVVRLTNGRKIMWYSTRGSATVAMKSYAAGVATTDDGITWLRRDSEVGIEKSIAGWDSEMICYPAVFNHKETTYMLYSGNGVGKGGIGYAVADKKLELLEW